jgi:hypothetical protein
LSKDGIVCIIGADNKKIRRYFECAMVYASLGYPRESDQMITIYM